MRVKKWIAFGMVCASALVCCTSCAVKFDYPIESKEVIGERVANAQAWDQAFRDANALAEKEGASYSLVVHITEGQILFNNMYSFAKNRIGYRSTGVLEGKAKGKISYTYNAYQSRLMIRMVDTGTCYREIKGGKAIDIVQNADGTYTGTDIGTDILADAIPITWTLFSIAEDPKEVEEQFAQATYLPEESCYYEEMSESGYTKKNWVWIVDGVVRKFRTERTIYESLGNSFALQEEVYEVYVGGMNGTVEIPEYTYDGLI